MRKDLSTLAIASALRLATCVLRLM